MAGEAKTTEFLLSTATIMVGPTSKVMELTPSLHSLGLVKNIQVQADVSFTELTQGIQQQVVSSVNTGSQTKITGELYEYTARNLAYGAQLDGSAATYDPIVTSYTLATNITTGGATVVLGTGGGADFNVGDFLVIQDTNNPDKLHVGKVASKATDTLTLATGYVMPSTMAFSTGSTVIYRVTPIKVGAVSAQPTMGLKMVGLLPESGQPITLIFPKVKITKGISLAFQTDNFANMPFEFTPYALVSTDNYYADFGSTKRWMVLRT